MHYATYMIDHVVPPLRHRNIMKHNEVYIINAASFVIFTLTHLSNASVKWSYLPCYTCSYVYITVTLSTI